MMEDEAFFISVRVDPDLETFFQVQENITLVNATLQANSIVFNGGTPDGGQPRDLIYEIDNFRTDITWRILDQSTEVPKDGDGRLIKRGTGELGLFPDATSYSGGTLLENGVIRTDAAGLGGDIQICSNDDDAEADASCRDTLLIFETPGVRIDEDVFSTPRATNGTYAGNITGETVAGENGRVLKRGVGQLTLTGNNEYDGGTYVQQGELVGDIGSIPGDIHICPSVQEILNPNGDSGVFGCDTEVFSRLTFNIETDAFFTNEIHGQGILAKDGDARLTLNADVGSTFFGTIEVERGTLEIEGAIGKNGLNAGKLLVVVEDGATLTGSGDAMMRDEIGGDVEVDPGGTIEGTLDIEGELRLNGTLDLKADGPQTATARINDGSVIKFDPMIVGEPGQLTVTGDVTLGAGSVDFEFDPDDRDTLVDGLFTLIEVGGTISGILTGGEDGDGVGSELAIYDLELIYDKLIDDVGFDCTGNVCLRAGFNPVIEDDARTENQRELARAIDHAYLCAQNPTLPECMISQETADDFNEVYQSFSVLSSEIPDILDEIAGEEYAAFADVRAAGTMRFNRSISRRFDLERRNRANDPQTEAGNTTQVGQFFTTPTAGFSAAASTTQWMVLGASALNMQDDNRFEDYRASRFPWRQRKPDAPISMDRHANKGGFTGWMDVHGVMGEVDGNSGADDLDYRIYGPLFGLDYGVSEMFTLGVTAGFTQNELKTPGSATKATGTTFQVGAYGAAMIGNFYVTGTGRFAKSDISSRRRVRFGDVDLNAKADFDATDASVFVEAAYAFDLPRNVMVQPVFSLAYNRLHQESFEERRAGSLNLDISSQDVDALQSHIGVRVALFAQQPDGGYLLPQLRIGYERELLDNDRELSGNLGSAGDNGEFDMTGLSLPRDRAVVGVSSEVGVSSSTNLFVDYDLRAAKDLLEHSLSFGVRAIW
jgi:autotransporter-associated beta strand protein